MARQSSELLSAAGTVFEVFKAVVDEVLGLGGSDEDVRKILKDGELRKKIGELLVEKVRSTFKVVVDYDKSLAELISAGKYDWVNSDITQEHFPVERSGQQEVKLVLFHFGKVMTSEQVISEMDRVDYRPAKIGGLLSLGARQPELQKEFPIVGLGSVWRRPGGRRRVPYLRWLGVGRDLSLHWFGDGWSEHYRFAAVRK